MLKILFAFLHLHATEIRVNTILCSCCSWPLLWNDCTGAHRSTGFYNLVYICLLYLDNQSDLDAHKELSLTRCLRPWRPTTLIFSFYRLRCRKAKTQSHNSTSQQNQNLSPHLQPSNQVLHQSSPLCPRAQSLTITCFRMLTLSHTILCISSTQDLDLTDWSEN